MMKKIKALENDKTNSDDFDTAMYEMKDAINKIL